MTTTPRQESDSILRTELVEEQQQPHRPAASKSTSKIWGGRRKHRYDDIPVCKIKWLAAYKKFANSLPSLSADRRDKYRYTILAFAKAIKKDPDKVRREDLEEFFDKKKAQGAKDWTVANYKLMLKRFYKKRKGKRFVEWLKIPKNIRSDLGPEDIISPEEHERMMTAADNLRDKAIISTLRESDFRPGEFLALKAKNVTFDRYGAKLHVERGKTGPRVVRVINSSPFLANYLENHPLRNEPGYPNVPMWLSSDNNRRNQPLQEAGLRKIVKRIALKAHITKRVWPYLFRHSRNTELAPLLTEGPFCEYAGWQVGSRMPSFYVHLSGRNVDDAVLKSYGIVKDEEKKKLPKSCPRCTMVCAPEEETCHRCGSPLSLELALKIDAEKDEDNKKLKDSLARNEKVQSLIIQLALAKKRSKEYWDIVWKLKQLKEEAEGADSSDHDRRVARGGPAK